MDLIAVLLEYLHRFNAVCCFNYRKPQAGEHDPGHVSHRLFIFDQQHRAATLIFNGLNRFVRMRGELFQNHRQKDPKDAAPARHAFHRDSPAVCP